MWYRVKLFVSVGLFVLTIVFGQWAALAQPPGTAGWYSLPSGAVQVRREQIIDRNGFGKPLPAIMTFVPVGWQTQGGIQWSLQNPCGSGYNINFKATSRDGRSGYHFFPMEQWQWNSMGTPAVMGCPVAQVTSVRQYMEGLVQRGRPGARWLDFRQRPDIVANLKHLQQVTPTPMGEIRAWVEAGEALIGYRQNGLEMRETMAVAVAFSLMRTTPMMGMPGTEYLTAATLPGFSMFAPHGQLNFRLAEMIRKSAKPTPEWSARIAQHNAKISNIQLQGARDRARITAQTGEEIRQMQADSWRIYNESSDRLARERSEAIRGVETYNDPYYGGSVQLDSSYNHAWQLNDGTYVLTDDPSFNPYKVFGQDGKQLRPLP